MYLRTPKRYKKPDRRHNLINWRRVLIWVVAPILIFVGVGIYENRDRYTDDVQSFFENLVGDASNLIDETGASPKTTPTPDPTDDLREANDAWTRGAIQEAVRIYEEAARYAPNDVLVHYRLALGYIMANDLDEALVAAENSVTASPYNADAWSIRAMALNRLEHPGEAIASALRALQLVPEPLVEAEPIMAVSRARALAFLAEAYLETGQVDRALSKVEEALDLNPDGFEAYQVRGRIYQEAYYDFDAALEDFRTANDLAPNMIYIAIWLARLEVYRYENYGEGVELYQNIIDLNADNPLALYGLADYYFRFAGNLAEATKYLERCIEAHPNDADCHYLLGRTLIRQQDAASAQISFRTAYNLNPENGYYIYWLAESYVYLGLCSQAIPYLQAGYQIAQQDQDQDLMEAYEISLQECRMPIQPESTPEVEAANGGV